MKVILKREARIRHQAGETVDVTPAEGRFLISTGSAVPAPATPNAAKTGTKKKEK